MMLLVRGADDEVELIDTTGATEPIKLSLKGDSRPVWDQADGTFYLAASNDKGATYGCWRVTTTGSMTSCGVAATDVANSGRELALIVKSADGVVPPLVHGGRRRPVHAPHLRPLVRRVVPVVLPERLRGRFRQSRVAVDERVGGHLDDQRGRNRAHDSFDRRVVAPLGPLIGSRPIPVVGPGGGRAGQTSRARRDLMPRFSRPGCIFMGRFAV
jgi:hypothetical protein